jgi:RNA polymerase sigma factor (sigma-70 family)
MNTDDSPEALLDRDPSDEADEPEDTDGAGVANHPSSKPLFQLQALPCPLDGEALALLVAQIMRQDEAAMASLYDALSGRVYAVALQVTGQIGSAEEVMQDTFWQVWRQAPRFDAARGSVVAWVLTMTRSRALDLRRANARNVLHALRQTVEDFESCGADTACDPLDLLDIVQRDSQLHATLATLDPIKRQLIALVFDRGLTHEELAAHAQMPLGTVKSHLRRAMQALRDTLGPDFNSQHVDGVTS